MRQWAAPTNFLFFSFNSTNQFNIHFFNNWRNWSWLVLNEEKEEESLIGEMGLLLAFSLSSSIQSISLMIDWRKEEKSKARQPSGSSNSIHFIQLHLNQTLAPLIAAFDGWAGFVNCLVAVLPPLSANQSIKSTKQIKIILIWLDWLMIECRCLLSRAPLNQISFDL